eukprot:5762240-Pleurochrysis_carterae.AAC.1
MIDVLARVAKLKSGRRVGRDEVRGALLARLPEYLQTAFAPDTHGLCVALHGIRMQFSKLPEGFTATLRATLVNYSKGCSRECTGGRDLLACAQRACCGYQGSNLPAATGLDFGASSHRFNFARVSDRRGTRTECFPASE